MNASHASDPFGLVGQVLDGQFRVEKVVGEGGFSAVYRGHHLGLDEPVAIKALKLPPQLGSQLVDNFVQRFRDESRILYRLSQGNLHIVRSIAAGTTKSPTTGFVVPYMVLEWLEGRSLANDFTVRKTLGNTGRSVDEVATLFATAADALAFAHAQGVVHRDLNPGNFFLAVTPQGMKMKVLDFGVAKILDDSTLNLGPRAQTMGQIRIFAPAYGSPEQFDDSLGKVGPHSDVYSFALILMEALRDRPVNDGTNLSDFATAAVNANKRPTPKALGLDVPDAVEQVFVRATKLRPNDRYADVGEMWRAFDAAVAASRTRKNDRPDPRAGGRPAPAPLSRTMPLGSPNMPSLPLPSASGAGNLKPPARAAGTAPLGASAQKAAAAALGPPKPRPTPNPIPSPAGAGAKMPPRPVIAQSPTATAKTRVAGSPSPPATSGGPSTQRFSGAAAPRNASRPASEPPLHASDGEEEEDEPTRVGNATVGASSMPSDPPIHGEQQEEDVTRVHAPDADVLAAAAAAATAGPSAPPPDAPANVRPSPPPAPPPSLGGTMMMQPGGGGVPLPPPPGAFVPNTPPAPEPPMHPAMQAMDHTMALGRESPFAPPAGHASLPPYVSQPIPQHPAPPSANVPTGPAIAPAGMPAHFAQPQQPPPFTYPTGAHPMPPFGDAAPAAPAPAKSGAPVGLIVGAVVLLVVALGGAAAFVFLGRPTATSATMPSASASVVVAPAPTPVPTPPPIATPTETQAANDPPPANDTADAAAVADDTPAPTTTATSTATAPTPTAGTNTWTPTTATAVPKPTASAEPVDPRAWNESAARARLQQANYAMAFCRQGDNPGGPGSATVTFAPEGTVTSVTIDPPYAGTKTGDCAAGQFKRAKLNAFDGPSRTIKHSFEVPK